jgi:hypothetical protein
MNKFLLTKNDRHTSMGGLRPKAEALSHLSKRDIPVHGPYSYDLTFECFRVMPTYNDKGCNLTCQRFAEFRAPCFDLQHELAILLSSFKQRQRLLLTGVKVSHFFSRSIMNFTPSRIVNNQLRKVFTGFLGLFEFLRRLRYLFDFVCRL